LQQGVGLRQRRIYPSTSDGDPREDKLRLMSESARGEGGRVWVPRNPAEKRAPKSIPDAERFYFLEEWYREIRQSSARDIATRAIHRIVYQEKLASTGRPRSIWT